MKFYLRAFCLDEDKAKEGFEELMIGPFDWFQITWNWVRAGTEDLSEEDHQFVLDESGFWYPLAYVKTSENSGSMQPDYARGRYTDIVLEFAEPIGFPGQTARRDVVSEQNKAALIAAHKAEQVWMDMEDDN